jgi:hypothetical protein
LTFRQLGGRTANQAAEDREPSGARFSADPEGYVLQNMDESEIKRRACACERRTSLEYPDEPELVSIYDHKDTCYFVRDMNVLIDRSVMTPLNDLMRAFYEATGIDNVNIVSGYRSYGDRQDLYDALVAREDGAAHAAMFVAQPGLQRAPHGPCTGLRHLL